MMILDTDVLSAITKPAANSSVVAWLNAQPDDSLCITAISLFEILLGIEGMPKGKNRRAVEESLERALRELIGGRILPFDEPAARVAAYLYGSRREGGIVIGAADTQIAGIAVSRGSALATRNVRHFPDLSVPVINPWEAA